MVSPKREKKVALTLTLDELLIIEREATKRGLTMASYLRLAALAEANTPKGEKKEAGR